MSTAYFITDIKQKDNFSFVITWNDGVVCHYRLSDLQKKCPCAGCQENKLSSQINENVKAVRIISIGRYALRIEFTSGCSAGIYSYDLLRSFINNPQSLTAITPSMDHE